MKNIDINSFKDRLNEITIFKIDELKLLSFEELDLLFQEMLKQNRHSINDNFSYYLTKVLIPDFKHNYANCIYDYCSKQVKIETFKMENFDCTNATTCYRDFEVMFFREMLIYNKIKSLKRKYGCNPSSNSFKWTLNEAIQTITLSFLPESSLDNIIKFIKDLHIFDLNH